MMKPKYIILTVALLFSLYTPVQAQNDEGGIWDGIAGTLTNMFDDAIQGTEAGRLFMLFNSDIRMLMKAHKDKEQFFINIYKDPTDPESDDPSVSYGFGLRESSSDASMYAEFDWDNKALSMHLKSTENTKELLGNFKGNQTLDTITNNKGTDHFQFTDKDGFWYVPFNHPDFQDSAVQRYVKFNAKAAAQNVAAGLSEFDLEILVNEITPGINVLLAMIALEVIPGGGDETFKFAWSLLGEYGMLIDKVIEMSEIQQLGSEIGDLLNEEYSSIVGFPVFIHWAFLYSPDFIRAKYNVTETTLNCNNIPNGCTKLTVVSGKEKGKFMIFDRYNRLIYIDSKKEGSVEFAYDIDLTVKIPPAWKMGDIIRTSGSVLPFSNN